MSEKRKDLLTEPNKRGFAPIVQPKGADKVAKGMDGDDDGGDGEPGEDETEKSKKVKKALPPPPPPAAKKPAPQQQQAQDGADDGDGEQGGGGDDQDQGDGDGKKPAPPPFMKKGGKQVSAEDLEKSLSKLGEFVDQNAPAPARKDVLLSKAQTEELTKSERDELFQILGSSKEEPVKPAVAAEVSKSLTGNDTIQKALDVSDYLQEQHTALVKSLETLGSHLEKSDKRQHDFNLLLAKAVGDIGGLMKSLVERVAQIETAPARAPKSKLGPQNVVQKSFAGAAPADGEGAQLTKSQIMDGMESLLQKSEKDGHGGRLEATGESILHAISKYESTNFISKSMIEAVKKELGAAAH